MTERKTYESRWGHHPCDHDTYLKLKKLYKFYPFCGVKTPTFL